MRKPLTLTVVFTFGLSLVACSGQADPDQPTPTVAETSQASSSPTQAPSSSEPSAEGTPSSVETFAGGLGPTATPSAEQVIPELSFASGINSEKTTGKESEFNGITIHNDREVSVFGQDAYVILDGDQADIFDSLVHCVHSFEDEELRFLIWSNIESTPNAYVYLTDGGDYRFIEGGMEDLEGSAYVNHPSIGEPEFKIDGDRWRVVMPTIKRDKAGRLDLNGDIHVLEVGFTCDTNHLLQIEPGEPQGW